MCSSRRRSAMGVEFASHNPPLRESDSRPWTGFHAAPASILRHVIKSEAHSSLAFMFWWAGLFVFPLMPLYTVISYGVFRGKVRSKTNPYYDKTREAISYPRREIDIEIGKSNEFGPRLCSQPAPQEAYRLHRRAKRQSIRERQGAPLQLSDPRSRALR